MKKYRGEYADKWFSFYWGKRFDISYQICGYFDARHRITIALGFFSFSLCLPIWSKMTDECDPPKYGIAIHHNKFWIHRGGKGNMAGGNKWWTFEFPWALTWVRTSRLRKDGTWEHEFKGLRKDFWKDEWNDVLWSESHPYTYVLNNGIVQERIATIRLDEREWRPKWFQWTKLFGKVSRTIDVEFNDEVGERTGSWKGGTIGCSYKMIDPELPVHTLRRMERDRKFN